MPISAISRSANTARGIVCTRDGLLSVIGCFAGKSMTEYFEGQIAQRSTITSFHGTSQNTCTVHPKRDSLQISRPQDCVRKQEKLHLLAFSLLDYLRSPFSTEVRTLLAIYTGEVS